MEIILTQDVKGQGKKGQIIKVKDGYGMNYLIKNGYGVAANNENVRQLNIENKKKAVEENEKIEEAKMIKQQLENKRISFKVKTGKQDQVFGSISSKQIAEQLGKLGFKIDKKKIKIDIPLSTLGTHIVEIELHKTVKAEIKVDLIS